ncbi:MAG TPA: C25 family cysteine peptidase, partial [Bacteroidia bacterium]|nr:C25 family cysteine peptidase [Bacteroidia bacterium]
FANIIQDSLFGGNVTEFLKTSSAPIQVNQSAYLQALIDSGVTMMTFVAHASGTTFDISTDIPQNYNNKDRYPLIVANSCFVGDIHTPDRLISEDFVLLPDKGSIGFIAEPSVGYLENLEPYTKQLYRQIGVYNYGGTVGNSMRNTIDSIITDPAFTANPYLRFMYKSVCMEMTLHGDPALVINSYPKAEYVINNPDVFFSPATVTAEADSFDVHVVVHNLGRVVNIPSTVHLVRKFPDNGPNLEIDTVISAVTFTDTLTFRMAVNSSRGTGLNLFDAYVDYFNTIDEYSDTNNSVINKPLLIQSSDILPVYPTEFAIVPNNTITLKASTANPFAPSLPYVFQIDTVDTFNSPSLHQTIISSPGGVIQWSLPFTVQPDLVYYWRVSRDSMATDTIHPKWNESSFIHIPSKTGWSQAHYSQFKKDKYTNVVYSNTLSNTFSFVNSISSLVVRNYQAPTATQNPDYEINNVVIDYQMCGTTPSVHIVVLDSISLKPWDTGTRYFGNANIYIPNDPGNCRQRAEYYFIFRMNDPAQRDLMKTMLEDSIPSGNYVIAYTVFNGLFSQWDPSLKQVFTGWGSDSITYLQDGQPWIFFTKKGNNSYTQEAIGDSMRTYITLSASLGGNWSKGFANSVEIGPAAQWTSLHWEQEPVETGPTADSAAIDIIGLTPAGQEVVLATGIQPSTADTNISWIDHNQFPKIMLRAYLQDEVLFSPPRLKRWQVYYDEIMELALNPLKHFVLNKDTLQEGDQVNVEMAIENISNVSADSVLTKFFYYDAANALHQIAQPRYKKLDPGDTLICSTSLSTSGIPGLNSLWIEANPDNDQPEQYHFNNLAEIRFQVDKDITNPILDVTFDGTHILDGDIVSGKPLIVVKLKDENKFLALNDTSDWQLFLKDPDGVQTKLRFDPAPCTGTATAILQWCPATLPDNTFNIQFKPELLKDGIYELYVQATDASGNLSGDNNYRITFEVINRSTITEMINYPNPFSTSTRFVFTLTGSEIPEYFKIQIMTVTGKIVREITTDELGPIHIGRNVTEYAWNGKDEYGDQLANGVYLYRVITVLNGSAVEKRETEADKYFKKGWGKMYLLR